MALFPASTILIQGAEYEWAMAQPVKPAFAPSQKIEKLAGDRDVWGDGSVVILSTPGHTPGHQSLLVVLPRTGRCCCRATPSTSGTTGSSAGSRR